MQQVEALGPQIQGLADKARPLQGLGTGQRKGRAETRFFDDFVPPRECSDRLRALFFGCCSYGLLRVCLRLFKVCLGFVWGCSGFV